MSDESLKDKIIINFAQKLASNESKIRNRSVKKLRNWLSSKSKVGGGFSEKELLKLWKGLHYCMWMCDKPLVQQELSESLSKLLHVFGKVDLALNFFSTFLKTQVREWFKTDRLRLDKFMMLIRMLFHEVFVLLQNHEWQTTHIRQLNFILSADILPRQVDQVPDGLKFHIISIYFGELAKVGSKKLVGSVLLDLLQPFIDVILVTDSNSLQRYVVKHVFDEILKQAKKKLLEAQDKAAAMCNEDPMEIEENEKENSRTLQFDCEALGDKLFELASQKSCRVRNRTSVYGLVKRFKKISEGIVEPSAPDDEEEKSDAEEQKALNKLVKFEDNIVQKERKRKTEKKKRKKPKEKADPESDQEEPATKKQKEDTQPEKKVKNKYKDGDTSVNKKGVKTKAKKETSGNSSNHQESNQSSTDDFLFEGGFVSDEENESADEDLNISTSSQDDQSVPSIKPTKTSNKKGSKSERTIVKSLADTEAVFEGGFLSSSDDNDEEKEQGPTTTSHLTRKSLNKKKQKKRNSAKLESELVEVESSGSVDEQSNKPETEELLVLSSDSVTSEKKKKKKHKSSGELDTTPVSGSKVSAAVKNKQSNCMKGSLTSEILEESSMGKKSNKKKKSQLMENGEKGKKKKRNMKTNSQVEENDDLTDDDVFDVSDMVEENSVEKECGSEEEVEIYIPNMKYQGKYKEWALKQAQVTPPNHVSSKTTKGASAEKKKKKSANKTSTPNMSTQFATFDKLLKTPPAFVRKAVLKSSPPKTDPRHNKIKRSDEENGAMSEGKRRVSFGLHKNVMQSTKDEASSSTLFLSDEDEYEQIDDIELWSGSLEGTGESLSDSNANKSESNPNVFNKSSERKSLPATVSSGKMTKERHGRFKQTLKKTHVLPNLTECTAALDTGSSEDYGKIGSSSQRKGKNDRVAKASGSISASKTHPGLELKDVIEIKEDILGNRNHGRTSSQSERHLTTKLFHDNDLTGKNISSMMSSNVVIDETDDLDCSLVKPCRSIKGQSSSPLSSLKNVTGKKKSNTMSSSSDVVIDDTDDLDCSSVKPCHSGKGQSSLPLSSLNTVTGKKKSITMSSSSDVVIDNTDDLNCSSAKPCGSFKGQSQSPVSSFNNIRSKKKSFTMSSSSDLVIDDTDDLDCSPSTPRCSVKGLRKSSVSSLNDVFICESSSSSDVLELKSSKRSPLSKSKSRASDVVICESNTNHSSQSLDRVEEKKDLSIKVGPSDDFICVADDMLDAVITSEAGVSLSRTCNLIKRKKPLLTKCKVTDDVLCQESLEDNEGDDITLPELAKWRVLTGATYGSGRNVSHDSSQPEIRGKFNVTGRKWLDDKSVRRNSHEGRADKGSESKEGKRSSEICTTPTQKQVKETPSCNDRHVPEKAKESILLGEKSSCPKDSPTVSLTGRCLKLLKITNAKSKLNDSIHSIRDGNVCPDQTSLNSLPSTSSKNDDKTPVKVKTFRIPRLSEGSEASSVTPQSSTTSHRRRLLSRDFKHLSVKSGTGPSHLGILNVQQVGTVSSTREKSPNQTEAAVNHVIEAENEAGARRRSQRIHAREEEDDTDDCIILDVSVGESPKVKYVRSHKLLQSDFAIIKNGDWLSDVHINLAHALLKKQFPDWQGLENCCLGNKKVQAFTPVTGKFVQVYNAHGNHWVTITNACCYRSNEVTIYDSYYRTVHADTKKVILNLLDDCVNKPTCTVIYVKMSAFQKQRAERDCGLFAIASATSLLFGEDPSQLVYKQLAMRPHLERCFHKQHMTPFPKTATGTVTKLQAKTCPIKLK